MSSGRRDKRSIAKKKRTSSCATGLQNLGASAHGSLLPRGALDERGKYQMVVRMLLVVEKSRPTQTASTLIGITLAMARLLLATLSRRAIAARMVFATMARMTFATIGRMERRMMTGYFTSIAIAIMKAIVVIMTVHACRIDRRANFYHCSYRLCDSCQWRYLVRIELPSRSASMPLRLGKRHLRVPLLE